MYEYELIGLALVVLFLGALGTRNTTASHR